MPSVSAPSKSTVSAEHENQMQEQYEMMQLQQKIQHDQTMITALSNIIKSDGDTTKGIASNLK